MARRAVSLARPEFSVRCSGWPLVTGWRLAFQRLPTLGVSRKSRNISSNLENRPKRAKITAHPAAVARARSSWGRFGHWPRARGAKRRAREGTTQFVWADAAPACSSSCTLNGFPTTRAKQLTCPPFVTFFTGPATRASHPTSSACMSLGDCAQAKSACHNIWHLFGWLWPCLRD